MRSQIFLTVAVLLLLHSCQYIDAVKRDPHRITIEVQIPGNSRHVFDEISSMDKEQIEYIPVSSEDGPLKWDTAKSKLVKRKIKWVIYSDQPVQIKYCLGWLPIVSPGDSIHITHDESGYIFSGTGSDKLQVWSQMMEIEQKQKRPTKYSLYITSLDDYFKWNDYVDRRLAQEMPEFDSYRDRMKPFEYDYLKNSIVSSAEEHRIYAFTALLKLSRKDTSLHISSDRLVALWDSTQYKQWSNWLRSLPVYYGSLDCLYNFNDMEIRRRFGFQVANDSLASKEKHALLNYMAAKEHYRGLLRERLMVYVLEKVGIKKVGVKNSVIQSMLKDYYQQAGFPQYKQWVRNLEKKDEEK